MRIHSDILTSLDIRDARLLSHTDDTTSMHGSRKRSHAYNVLLTGSSTRRPNSGKNGADSDDYAATWDEWGIFLGHLFKVDPNAVTPYYADANDFHRQTDYRFENLAWEDQCRTHNWEYVMGAGHTCKKCGARQVR